ncbi:MAG: Hsp20/alpha crystallin family protein [Methylocystis sp.]
MANQETNVPVKKTPPGPRPYSELLDFHPLESFRRQMHGLFSELPGRRSFADFEPFERFLSGWPAMPAVDLAEKDGEFTITAELPGLDEKDVEVKLANGTLTISGEKKDERESKDKDHYFSERRYGSFKRSFRVPEGVDTDKIDASFDKGVLTIKLPKTAEARKAEKKIEIKSK